MVFGILRNGELIIDSLRGGVCFAAPFLREATLWRECIRRVRVRQVGTDRGSGYFLREVGGMMEYVCRSRIGDVWGSVQCGPAGVVGAVVGCRPV